MPKDWLEDIYDPGLVCVVIPVHNQERFLDECLQSVIDQDYRPLEIIIVDDGSMDGSGKIIEEFQKTCREGIGVKCLRQSKQGAQAARNSGCRIAAGEFFLFLDGDDLLSCHKLSEQVDLFNNYPEVDIVYSDGQFFNDGFDGPTENGGLITMGGSQDVIAALLYGLWVPCFSYLYRRRAVQRCGPWDPTIPINQDFEYVLRMATTGCRFRYSAGLSGFYRKHSSNTISNQSKSLRGRTTQRILLRAERRLKERGEFTDVRVETMIDHYRRIAGQVYSWDKECFRGSLDAVLRLRPGYRPKRRRARFLSSVLGFRNYEKVSALISPVIQMMRRYLNRAGRTSPAE